jgi:hypothetical protein
VLPATVAVHNVQVGVRGRARTCGCSWGRACVGQLRVVPYNCTPTANIAGAHHL